MTNKTTDRPIQNKRALEAIEKYAIARCGNAKAVMDHVSYMANISEEKMYQVFDSILSKGRIALHFHPDRICNKGSSVAASMLDSTVYQNQFQSKCSNGKLAPEKGGSRDHWENALFENAYSAPDLDSDLRPRYGALDLLKHNHGPAPRFGSCFFVLKAEVNERASFTFGDSHSLPKARGTTDLFDLVYADLLEQSFVYEHALGESCIRPNKLLEKIETRLNEKNISQRFSSEVRNLDQYIEAQVHGPIYWENDIEAVFVDDSFIGTVEGEALADLAMKNQFDLYWKDALSLNLENVPNDFRGPEMPNFAAKVLDVTEGGSILQARHLGLAAKILKSASSNTTNNSEQLLKLLWHTLLKYGQ